jgi:hypothetical protein
MPGTKTFTLSLLAAAALCAQPVEYLPLQAGNVWVYRGSSGSFTVEAGKPALFGGNEYFPVRGLPATPALWLRNTPEGRIMMWDAASSQEKIWLDTSTPVAGESPSSVDPCNPFSRIESREWKYSGPLGEFTNALAVRYSPGSCADAGLDADYFLPWVGLAQRVSQSIAGPRQYDLVYARLGGVTVLSAPETGFGIALTQTRTSLDARLTLRHTAGDPLNLVFPTSQHFDLALYNENGKLVYQWSEGRGFTQALTTVTVSGEKFWLVEVPLARIAPGAYAVRAWLTTTDGPVYLATSAVLIRGN